MCMIKQYMVFLVERDTLGLFLQGPAPSGKNEEKVKVLTEKIEDLVVQVCNKYGKIRCF